MMIEKMTDLLFEHPNTSSAEFTLMSPLYELLETNRAGLVVGEPTLESKVYRAFKHSLTPLPQSIDDNVFNKFVSDAAKEVGGVIGEHRYRHSSYVPVFSSTDKNPFADARKCIQVLLQALWNQKKQQIETQKPLAYEHAGADPERHSSDAIHAVTPTCDVPPPYDREDVEVKMHVEAFRLIAQPEQFVIQTPAAQPALDAVLIDLEKVVQTPVEDVGASNLPEIEEPDNNTESDDNNSSEDEAIAYALARAKAENRALIFSVQQLEKLASIRAAIATLEPIPTASPVVEELNYDTDSADEISSEDEVSREGALTQMHEENRILKFSIQRLQAIVNALEVAPAVEHPEAPSEHIQSSDKKLNLIGHFL